MIAAHRLLRRAKKSRSMKLQNIKQRLVTSLKFSCKGISKKRLKAPLTLFRNVLKLKKRKLEQMWDSNFVIAVCVHIVKSEMV